MKQMQLGGNSIRLILLMLIISMSLSACTVRNDPENSFPASEVSDKHSGSGSADTQTVTDLTVEDVPALVPDVLKLREKKYEDIPFLETQEQLSEYALWNLLCGKTAFECRLSWDLSYDVSAVALERACQEAMAYYLFSSYKVRDMLTVDDGNPDSLYGKVKLLYTLFYLVITVIQIAAELADVMLLSPDLRAAEKDLKELISDYRFMKEQNIHTVADLQANIDESKAQLSNLERERKELSNRIRRPKSPEDENKNKDHRKAVQWRENIRKESNQRTWQDIPA